MNDIVVVIPSFCPPANLPQLCATLHSLGLKRILIVNDGSPESYGSIFKEAQTLGCEVISYQKNQGKGAAIKVAIKHLLQSNYSFEFCLFCDDDGQHSPKDILRVSQHALNEKPDCVLGCRDFAGSHVPFKSWFGNFFMRQMIALIHSYKIHDSQTGLRCYSKKMLSSLERIPDNQFGFELQALLQMIKNNNHIVTIPIETIYFSSNAATRFNPLLDSAKVLWAAITTQQKK